MEAEDFAIVLSERQTLRLRADQAADVERAAAMLACGETVAFPTETVYGLGANAFDPAAVSMIFAAKQRPSWDPLIVHISGREMLLRVAALAGAIGTRAELLIDAFWPGPLTLLLPRTTAISDAVTAGRPRVGVRMPAHAVAISLIERAGVPVAAPSANRFGHTSPTTAAHVLDDLDGRIGAVLDGGATEVGLESTVLDVCELPMRIYRPGAISAEQIAACAGPVEIYITAEGGGSRSNLPESLPSPGVGLRHYAPRARLVLVGSADELLAACESMPEQTGVLLPEGWQAGARAQVVPWGRWEDPEGLARGLFRGLRELDAMGVAVIVCPLPAGAGMGAAMRDRLEKAARRS